MGEILRHDIHYGLRMLRKNPGYTIVALLALGLGIGVNTAFFSLVYGVLLKPLPYTDGERLVVLRQEFSKANRQSLGFSVKEIQDYRAQSRSMAQMEEYHQMAFILLDAKEPRNVSAGVVSAHFFDLLGIKPYLGRSFTDADDKPGAEPVLILSYSFWKMHYGGDRNIVGQHFSMNDNVHTVIGVLPPVPQYPRESDIFIPTVTCPTRTSQAVVENRDSRLMRLFGRLKPGQTIESGRQEMSLIASRLQRSYPESYPPDSGFTATLDDFHTLLTQEIRPMLFVLLGTAALVLLIACANVANLSLANMLHRKDEFAVRAALGASRGRLMCQLLTESTMLSLGGGIIGLALARGTLNLLVTFAARFTTRAAEITISMPVLLFTLIISVATGLIFGAFPALSQRLDLVNFLKEGSNSVTEKTSGRRLRHLMAIGQVAISFMLLVGAGLMIRSLIKLQQVQVGYNSANVLSASVSLNFSKYATGKEVNKTSIKAFFDRVEEKLEGLPGIEAVAVSGSAPLATQKPWSLPFFIEGRPPREKNEVNQVVNVEVATPNSFHVLEIPLMGGRFFTTQDNGDSPLVIIISQSFARHYFPNEDPLGKRVSADQKNWSRIVGIVGDVRQYSLDQDPADTAYLPFAQVPMPRGTFMIKTTGDPMNYANQVRKAVYAVDPEQPIKEIKTLDQLRGETLATTRLTSLLLGLFALLALVIAAIGLSGITSLLVSERTREMGIRLALGARHDQVLLMVLTQTTMVIVVGLALGVALTLVAAPVASNVMQTLLFRTRVIDPLTLTGVTLVLATVALIASYIPARRVTRVDPIVALRID